jgi:hypothetical protein
LDSVYDTGGFDVADVSSLNRSDVSVHWADLPYDGDGGCDSMSIISQVPSPIGDPDPTDAITFNYYFDNKGADQAGVPSRPSSSRTSHTSSSPSAGIVGVAASDSACSGKLRC